MEKCLKRGFFFDKYSEKIFLKKTKSLLSYFIEFKKDNTILHITKRSN